MPPPCPHLAARALVGAVVACAALGAVTTCARAGDKRRFFASCGADDECASGKCHYSVCTASCSPTQPCAAGICVESVCAPTCGGPAPCPGGWPCVGGQCLPGPARRGQGDTSSAVDSGTDAAADGSALPAGPKVARIAAGEAFTCALSDDGSTRCWGIAYNGQLGTGDGDTRHAPTPATIVPAATALVAALDHACAIVAGGKVVCWGGTGTGAADGKPAVAQVAKVAVDGQAVALAAGQHFTCALLTDASVACWGDNTLGQLGDGSKTSRPTAKPVIGLPKVKAIAAGDEHACALSVEGGVWCWGQFAAGWDALAAGHPYTKPIAVPGQDGSAGIVAGGLNTCTIAVDGSARCWGDNGYGQLGVGHDESVDGPTAAPVAGKVARMALGVGHACAIGLDGSVRCWGQGGQGQLGDGKATRNPKGVVVPAVAGALDVAVGPNHSCALLPKDEVWCWGANDQGQIGTGVSDNEALPVQMGNIVDAKAVTVGHSHVCVLRSGGGAWCAGNNGHGQLGSGGFASQLQPLAVAGLAGANRLAAGQVQICATVAPRDVRCWGGDLFAAALTPAPVAGLPVADDLAIGTGTTCAIADGGAWCFGNDEQGSLGDGPKRGPSGAVVQVVDVSEATSIAGAWQTFCVTRATGAILCWGRNELAQTGTDSAGQPVPAPVPVGLPGGVADPALQIALAYDGGCARTKSGAIVCWGDGGKNHTGKATALPPAKVPGFAAASDIALSDSTLCAVSAGKLSCVGGAVPGGWQSGEGPKAVTLPASVVDLAAGPHAVCAALANGTVWCWGYNEFGQLGNGKGPVVVPVRVLP